MDARRLIASAILLGTAACSSVHSVSPPVPYIEANSPDQVWITTNSGEHSLVYRPRILQDSIFGFDLRGQQMTMPVEIVKAAQVKTIDRQKSFLAGAGLAVVAGTGVFLFAKNAAATGSKKCEGSAGNAVCEGKSNTTERTSNGGIKIPMSTATKLVGGLARALLGN